MPTPHDASVELIGELAAYRATCHFLLKALNASLAGLKEPERTLVVEEIERQFTVRRGEWLHPAPPDINPELQAIGNRFMQQALKGLGDEISHRLRTTAEPKT